ncbi:unnamed protein product, partial [Brassica oleracea]
LALDLCALESRSNREDLSMVIALFDMHVCGEKRREVKRFNLKMNPYHPLSSSFRRSYVENNEEA